MDCGVIQADALTVDRLASLDQVEVMTITMYETDTCFIYLASVFNHKGFSLFSFLFYIQYVQTAVIPRASILAAEIEWLKSINADVVVRSC